METGKVYVVHNESIRDEETGEMPYKIGITKNTVDERYYGLGLKMPGKFVCDFAYEFNANYKIIEQEIHQKLNQYGVWYKFEKINSKEISIQLGCSTINFPDMENLLISYNSICINNHKFEYKLPNKYKNNGWKGLIYTIISINNFDDIISTMKLLIDNTKQDVINTCI
jgi:hypothetical protein